MLARQMATQQPLYIESFGSPQRQHFEDMTSVVRLEKSVCCSIMVMKEKKELTISHRERQLRGNADTAAELSHQLEGEKLSPWTPALFRLYVVLAAAYMCGCLVCTQLENCCEICH
jgi:hypothetical protein